MNEQQARLVLLVKAVESAQPSDAVLSTAQRDAAGAQAQADNGRLPSDAQRAAWTESFMVRRAQALWHLAVRAQPRLELLQGDAWLMRVLRWGLPVLGLASGLGVEWWVSPRDIDVISPALVLMLLWNLLVYLWLLGHTLRQMGATRRGAPWPARALAWLGGRRWRLGLVGKVGAHFQRDWLLTAGGGVAQRLMGALHLAVALCALGMLAALYAKGLFHEFRVGWESQWLDASQLHTFMAMVGAWTGAPALSLQDIQRLQGGVAATKADGSVWALWWAHVLVVWVVVPRLALAAWAGVRAWGRMRRLRLDMTDPYFVHLLADHGGPATAVLVLPYSLHTTAAHEAGLRAAVRSRFGAAATLQLCAPVAYGEALSALPALAPGRQRQTVVLFGLGATPEAETHVAFVRQVAALAGAQPEVWLDSSTFSAHLPQGARAARLAEREALWRDALGTVPVRVWHLEQSDANA